MTVRDDSETGSDIIMRDKGLGTLPSLLGRF